MGLSQQFLIRYFFLKLKSLSADSVLYEIGEGPVAAVPVFHFSFQNSFMILFFTKSNTC